jgi:hypothetical protein
MPSLVQLDMIGKPVALEEESSKTSLFARFLILLAGCLVEETDGGGVSVGLYIPPQPKADNTGVLDVYRLA